MQCVRMRNAERQHGARLLSEKQQFIMEDYIEIIWTQSKSITEILDAKWKHVSNE